MYDVTLMTSNYRGLGSRYGHVNVEMIGENNVTTGNSFPSYVFKRFPTYFNPFSVKDQLTCTGQ